ncbi:glutamate racemase [Duganella violaceipulchra]|uniref:Glutamate racemase n=1 Tax=Duganella violaceipulchra TaxID=2849652 RepID=A0AA41HA85_9BURK|nr:glutamate racemase [Duganella violaceicalia]MBV6324892.1 glutamate racemase [Duganella violaceicalia]MCP2012358.1 glutamate racemase [Duganella violaceicalia]
MHAARSPGAPIGVYDSGVGGLSVLRHIRARLPAEDLIYFADSGHAPYGEKTEQYVVDRALLVAAFLLERGIKALVVACNTATVAAIKAVRARYPDLPVVGVEPGLKPAAATTRNGKIGVLATARTLKGEKFLLLREQIGAATQAQFLLQPCVGLVDQIELGDLETPAIAALLEQYVAPLLDQGADTLVLGCTHYPFVQAGIERVLRAHGHADVTLIDTGDAVARQLVRLLDAAGLLRPARTAAEAPAALRGYTTASVSALAPAFANLLGLYPPVEKIDV